MMYYIKDDEVKQIDVLYREDYLTYGKDNNELVILTSSTALYETKTQAELALRTQRYKKLKEMFNEYNKDARVLKLEDHVDFIQDTERVQGIVTEEHTTYYVVTDALGKKYYVNKRL